MLSVMFVHVHFSLLKWPRICKLFEDAIQCHVVRSPSPDAAVVSAVLLKLYASALHGRHPQFRFRQQCWVAIEAHFQGLALQQDDFNSFWPALVNNTFLHGGNFGTVPSGKAVPEPGMVQMDLEPLACSQEADTQTPARKYAKRECSTSLAQQWFLEWLKEVQEWTRLPVLRNFDMHESGVSKSSRMLTTALGGNGRWSGGKTGRHAKIPAAVVQQLATVTRDMVARRLPINAALLCTHEGYRQSKLKLVWSIREFDVLLSHVFLTPVKPRCV